jgi:type III pantothenate kinase
MRTLLLDLGNTRLKWKIFNESDRGALTHHSDAACWQPLWSLAKPDQVLLASVQSERAANLLALIKQEWAIQPVQVRTPARFPCADGREWVNAYSEPARLGVDRFLAMIAAMKLAGDQRLCVSMVGTAQTIDVVDALGKHLGGLILPGPNLMRTTLHQNTAALPLVDREETNTPWLGTNTESGIAIASLRAGAALLGQVCAEHQVAHCLISGGAAKAMIVASKLAAVVHEELVLTGLECWADHSI